MEIFWKMHHSINEFDDSIWNNKIAQGNPFVSAQMMAVVEKTYPDNIFYYFLGYGRNDELLALAYYSVSRLDILVKHSSNFLLKSIRKIIPSFMKIPLGMTASWLTCGRHSWFDEEKLKYEDFSKSFLKEIRKKCAKHFIIVWRDYLNESNNQLFLKGNEKLGFVNADTVSISKINIKKDIKAEDYLYLIKKKHRTYIRKVIKIRNKQNVKIEFVKDYLPLLDTVLYPLYENVNGNAKEYQSGKLPKIFFKNIKDEWKEDAEVLIVKDEEGYIMAFVLLVKSDNVLNPFLIGMDYSKREYNLWYNCTWESIVYAIENNLTEIDLGATNFQMKQKLGAVEIDNVVSLRFRNNMINPLLKKILVNFA